MAKNTPLKSEGAEESAALDTPAAKAAPSEWRKVLLLIDCAAGKCAQVVKLLAHEAESLIAGGHADDHPDAIAAHED